MVRFEALWKPDFYDLKYFFQQKIGHAVSKNVNISRSVEDAGLILYFSKLNVFSTF